MNEEMGFGYREWLRKREGLLFGGHDVCRKEEKRRWFWDDGVRVLVLALALALALELSLDLRAMMTCQWFLTALSVRPGNSLAIMAHLFPWTLWDAISLSSSSSVNGLLLIRGSNWLNHLSRQLFPEGTSTLIHSFIPALPRHNQFIYLSTYRIFLEAFELWRSSYEARIAPPAPEACRLRQVSSGLCCTS